MKLELLKAQVKGIAWGEKTALSADGTLTVAKAELLEFTADNAIFESMDADIARPGESVRIVPVKDVVEPRCKVEGSGEVFPGMIGDVDTVGSGKTFVLKDAAVVTTGKIVNFQEGIVDMTGTGAAYTPFSKTMNLVLVFRPKDGIDLHDYEKACRIAGLKAAFAPDS